MVDYNIFVKVTMPGTNSDPQRLHSPEDFHFRLKPGSAAIDAGVALPSINDTFSGRAPDLGAPTNQTARRLTTARVPCRLADHNPGRPGR